MSDHAEEDGSRGVPDSTSGTSADGGGWEESALNWAILTMHHLSSTAGAGFSSEAEAVAAITALDHREQQCPEPCQHPGEATGDEADSAPAADVINNVLQSTLHNLHVRRTLLQQHGADAGATGEDSAAMGEEPETCVSPEIEAEEGAADAIAWLPFPTKRPSQMTLQNWISDFQSSSNVAGQFKRQRLASPLEVQGEKAAPMGVLDETDTGPDKGAYLAMMRKRQELADELIATEKSYVEDIEALLKHYYDGFDYGSLANVPNSLRGKKNIVFGNLKKILEFNKSLFAPALAAIQKTPLKIGVTFMEFERELGLYSLYFKNMPAQEDLLQENIQFFRSIQIRLNDPYTFQSYLIKPMQRMTKYKQFLESFVNYTPRTEKMEKFHEELSNALWLVRFQLRHGNDLLVLDRLKGFDGNPNEQGLLLRQGEFTIQQKRSRHERQVFLFEDMLILAKKQKPSKGAKDSTYQFKDSYKVCDMGVVEVVDGSPSKFELYFKKHNVRESIFFLPVATDGQSVADIHGMWVADVQKLLWQQFKRVKERLENMRSGVEASLFGNKRASTIYGEAGYYASPADQMPKQSSFRIPSITSAGSKEGGARISAQTAGSSGYAVPIIPQSAHGLQREGSVRGAGGKVEIGNPVLQTVPSPPAPAATLYAVSAPVVVGSKAPGMAPPPSVPPPPVPSTETSASSAVSLPPLPPRQAPPPVPADYLLPNEPRRPIEIPSLCDDLPPPVPVQKSLTSPTRAPPPPPVVAPPAVPASTADESLPAIPGGEPCQEATGNDGDDEPIYDEVSDDEFDDDDDEDEFGPPSDPDRATIYEEVDGKRVRVRKQKQ